jgi:hypothetical protein
MDLRRRTTQGLAAAGALLIVVGLSLGSGVAVAAPGPEAAGPPDAVKATNTSSDTSDPSSDKPRKKDRKSKKSTSTTSSDATDSGSGDSGSGDSGSGTSGSTESTVSTATTATTTAPSTVTTATATTVTTRPTATSAPTTTATTSNSNGAGGTYDGKPISAAEDDDSTTTTFDDGRDADSPAPARRPAARDGSDLPPGIYPVGPGARTANSPAPSSTPAPAQPVMPNPPIVVTETQPAAQTTSSTAAAGATEPSPELRNANQVQEEAPAPVAPKARQLGQTGDGTRRLVLFGGVALLLGAVVVGFTGRDGPILAAAAALPAGPVRRRAKPRRELDGWEEGVPLAPAKRELARQRLGLSADVWCYDDEPGA